MPRAILKYISSRSLQYCSRPKTEGSIEDQDVILHLFYYTLAENFTYLGYLGVSYIINRLQSAKLLLKLTNLKNFKHDQND